MDQCILEKGIISLSFDDARKDTYHVFKDILLPRHLKGVVYVPSGYIEKQHVDPDEIGYNGMMTKEDLDWVYSHDMFEVSGHGYMHKNDFDDLNKGIDTLKRWYPDFTEYGLASPRSEINSRIVHKNIVKYKEIGFSYVRGGRNFESFTALKRLLSLIARITKSPFLFLCCYRSSLIKKNDFYLNAIPIHKLTSLEQVKRIVEYCADKKIWGILEFHGIDKRDSAEYSEIYCWAEDDFIELCDYLCSMIDQGRIEVNNPLNVCKRMGE